MGALLAGGLLAALLRKLDWHKAGGGAVQEQARPSFFFLSSGACQPALGELHPSQDILKLAEEFCF